MSIQLSPRKDTDLPECCREEDGERNLTPEEVKKVLTYTCYDALNDVYKKDADIALDMVPDIAAEYEKVLANYHENCLMAVDTAAVKQCHDIVSYLSGLTGKVECTTDSSADYFGISVNAYVKGTVSFAGDNMETLCGLLEQCEFKASVPYHGNELCLSFYVQIGRYVPKETM